MSDTDIAGADMTAGAEPAAGGIAALADFLVRGGPVVAILVILSVFVTAVVLLKLWQFARWRVGRHGRARHAVALWLTGDGARAYELVAGHRNPVEIVLAHAMRGLRRGPDDETRVREDVERVARHVLARLRSHFRSIEAVAQVAPLIGLFGTVLGMIEAFRAMQGAGADVDPALLAGGIWVALLTTAVGLAIAIPAGLVLYWLEGTVTREAQWMENALTSLFTGCVTEDGPCSARDEPAAVLRPVLAAAHAR